MRQPLRRSPGYALARLLSHGPEDLDTTARKR